jgi:hypothetical protein
MQEALGDERRARLRAEIQGADVFVLTVGVAPCFFDRETGEFAFNSLSTNTAQADLNARCVMRTTTVAENVENLAFILDALGRLGRPDSRIVLTLSPVPLSGTTELYSAITADCLSKSTLRVACHEITTARPEIIYWPSFEIVRWLGVNFSTAERPVFGMEDGSCRHVSNWVVEMVVRYFLKHHLA